MRKAGGDVGQGMESENGEVYEVGASRKHVSLKLICSAMETWVVLLLAVFASIELFLVRHQVCFRRRNSFGQASEGLQKTLTKPNVQTRIEC